MNPATIAVVTRLKSYRLSSPGLRHLAVTWLIGIGLMQSPLLLADQSSAHSKAADLLMERVGPPSALAMRTFQQAGMLEVKPHTLTSDEKLKIENALAALPSLHQRVLLDKLDRIAFVDGIPGEGTGLTSPGEHPGHFDITLRASLIDETLSAFLTTKERRDFSNAGSDTTVTVDGHGVSALQYVVLHESTHVLDRTCHITADNKSPFVAGVWADSHKLSASLSATALNDTYFRTGKPLEIAKAPAVYDALSNSPFVSLYSTAASAEDFAELVAWHEVRRDGGSLTITLSGGNTPAGSQWHPLAFAGVDKRFGYVDDLLAHPERYGCASYAS
jgi:hypothetical protein